MTRPSTWTLALSLSVWALLPATALAQQTLTTTYAGGNGFHGNMFDVVAKEQVTLTSFDANLATGMHTVDVYYKVGTYVGFESNSGAWTLLGTSTVTSAGQGAATPLGMSLNLTIPKNARYGLYIVTRGTPMQYTDGASSSHGQVYIQDANLQIMVGAGGGQGFSSMFTPRVWNGTVRYNVGSSSPSISAIGPQTTREDLSAQVAFTVADPDTPVTSLVTTATSSNQALLPDANLSIQGSGANRTLAMTPAPDRSGSATVTVSVSDGVSTRQAMFTLTVTPVNDAPSFVPGPDVTVLEDAGAVTRAGWATMISAGPADEAAQTLTFLVTHDNPALFQDAPAISPGGTLTFRSAPNAHGSATVTVRLRDSGGTADGGQDTSAPVTRRIHVTPVNDPPTAASKSVTTAEDTPVQITLEGADLDGDALTYVIASPPMHGTLSGSGATRTYSPAADYNGTDAFTYRVSDGQAQSAPATVSITITPVNDAPRFIAPTPVDGAMFAIQEGELLSVRVATLDPDADVVSLMVSGLPQGASFNPGTGQITWTPTFAQVGSHVIQIVASDGALSATRQISVVVRALDSDGDGLPDAVERALGLNPNNPDSDADTIRDDEEVGPDPQRPRDTDGDGVIDALDLDSDEDGLSDAQEAGDADLSTPAVDTDGDGVPDYRDTDSDGDGVADGQDNCPLVANPDQLDLDGDGSGDLCDQDMDGDGLPNAVEIALGLNPRSPDSDADTIRDDEEVGPDPQRPRDTDGDGVIDALDLDSDEDGLSDAQEAGDADLSTPAVDTDGDGVPDYRDTDSDGDGVADGQDNCPLVANPDQLDTTMNGVGDACDQDLDGDGVPNAIDNCPRLANPDQADRDMDGLGDACDGDRDGDGRANEQDNCPDEPNADQADQDMDGVGDVCDDDRDGDGVPNAQDNCPRQANADQADQDMDGLGDVCDDDRDGDGVPNAQDACPNQAAMTANGCPPAPIEPDMAQPMTPDMGGSPADPSDEPRLVDSGVAGCGCAQTSASGASGWALLWLLGLGVARRRCASRRAFGRSR